MGRFKCLPIQAIFAVTLLMTASADPLAQEGPWVPCAGISCEDPLYTPWPETGSWYNPQQSGTGLTVEIQNGRLLAYYFGYNAEGEPEWLLLTGPLQPGETPGVQWQLEAAPLRVSGGNCLGCTYVPPTAFEPQPPIRIEFLQRAHARVTPEGAESQYFVPLLYGDNGIAFFEGETPYKFPLFSPSPYVSLWSMVFKSYSDEEQAPWTWFSTVVLISEGRLLTSGPDAGRLFYRVQLPANPPEVVQPFGEILCGTDAVTSEIGCIFENGLLETRFFQISIGNLTDARFFGEAEDGTRLEAFRLQYD